MDDRMPRVPLKSIIEPISRVERIDPIKRYRILGAHWYAGGLYTKYVKPGSQIRAKELYRVEKGDLVYNKLFAWKGSFAVATEENHGCYVSGEYPCFRFKDDASHSPYVSRYLSLPSLWQQALGLSAGGTPTSRNRLRKEKFLEIEIPLPSLGSQRRIASEIDDLEAKVNEVKKTRIESSTEVSKVLLSSYTEIVKGSDSQPLARVAPLVRRAVIVSPTETYRELGIRSFGRGTFHKPPISGATLGAKRVFRVEPGDLMFNIVFAWEGAVAIANPADAGFVGSHRFLSCVPKQGLATAPFLWFYFLTDDGLEKLGKASPGGAGRNRTLGLEALQKIEVPLPTFEKQVWFDRLVEIAEALRSLHEEVLKSLDSFLPSYLDRAFRVA